MLLIRHKNNGNHEFYFQYRNFKADPSPLTGIVPTRLIRALNVENAADVLIFAFTHKYDELKMVVLKYINK